MNPELERVLVFGGAGYLGSVLSECLLEQGYRVTIYDSLLYGQESIADLVDSERCALVQGDVRDAASVARTVKEHDAVILLSALVGEASCARDPEETVSVNVLGSLNVLEACRYYGLGRFVFASTDSCYGAQTGVITELNSLQPLSLYAETKELIEQRILAAWTEESRRPSVRTGTPPGFGPIILRMATLYGLSRRMRFDLVLNTLAWSASIGGRIPIYGGEQWRPLVHVRDAAAAYVCALEAPAELVVGQVFNVGSNEQNVQIKDLGQLVAREFPEAETEWVEQPPDLRDYHVDFSKISRILGWHAHRSMREGVREIHDAIRSGRFGDELLPQYRNS